MMELKITSMTPADRLYAYNQSSQLEGQTGCIGHLRGDFGAGKEFYTSWFDHRREYKTDEFIWSNYGLDYEDWRDDLEAEYPDLSENERISLMYEINGDYLDDERANLNVQLSQPILVVGDLGLWNGRRMGYKEIPSGNIRDCLYSDTDYSTWYVDRLGDLRCDAIHHDGTNFYLYRVYKDSASPSQIELLKEKLYRGIATRADITRVTRRLGDDIAKVYGFSIPRQRQAVAMER